MAGALSSQAIGVFLAFGHASVVFTIMVVSTLSIFGAFDAEVDVTERFIGRTCAIFGAFEHASVVLTGCIFGALVIIATFDAVIFQANAGAWAMEVVDAFGDANRILTE